MTTKTLLTFTGGALFGMLTLTVMILLPFPTAEAMCFADLTPNGTQRFLNCLEEERHREQVEGEQRQQSNRLRRLEEEC